MKQMRQPTIKKTVTEREKRHSVNEFKKFPDTTLEGMNNNFQETQNFQIGSLFYLNGDKKYNTLKLVQMELKA